MRNKPALTNDDVVKIAAAAKAEALKNGWRLTIAIVDDGGRPWYLERMDGAMPMTTEIALGKARTSAVSSRPSRIWADRVAGGDTQILRFPEILPVLGGVPIIVDGTCVGGVGCSGATGAEDEQAALVGVAAVTG
jgi:uncharacterized protein GlcG (DUF336 family)